MAKATDRVDRTVEFWRTRRVRKFLLTERTIELLRHSIEALDSRVFTLQHVQALNLAVSLLEAQMRDCLRLAIDERNSELDAKNEFLDIKIDVGFITQIRSRRFTLGEFVSINTGISTIERLWAALSFCLPYDHEARFPTWCEQNGRSPCDLSKLKGSLAWVYRERNRYVHEFFDDTALEIGESNALDVVAARLRHAYDFLMYVQWLKKDCFSYEDYTEDHPSWGEAGKDINEANKRIEQLIVQITGFLRHEAQDDSYIESVWSSLAKLIPASEEYTDARADFAYTTFGPGGVTRQDVAALARLAGLKELESILTLGLENVRAHTSTAPEDGPEAQ